MLKHTALKQLLNNVLEKKNKTMNTIYNDSNLNVKQLKTMVEELGITEESFEKNLQLRHKIILLRKQDAPLVASFDFDFDFDN